MDIITKMLNMQEINFNSLKEDEKFYYLEAETKPSEQICPCCGKKTSYIHGYRMQKIKDIAFNCKNILINLRKRRYICKECGKTFFEKYSFLPKYAHATHNFFSNILHRLIQTNRNLTDIAKEMNCSPTTVARVLKPITVSKPDKLPVKLGIDEFKGNTDGEKYNLILTNIDKNTILDILPTRKKEDIIAYFKTFSLKEREKVLYFVMDMTGNYKDISYLFPNAKIVVDKYHYTRQVYWALDRVRKKIQKRFCDTKRIYFKHSRKLLYKRAKDLSDDQRQQLDNMLAQSEELRQAWLLKEHFVDFSDAPTIDKAIHEFNYWILEAEDFGLKEFNDALTAFHNWGEYIINARRYDLTNAVTEGFNNKIKVLKRTAYGFKKFENFRKRILLMPKLPKRKPKHAGDLIIIN